MAFLVTTTGLNPTVTLSDLNNVILTHPTINYDLEGVFTIVEISASEDLGQAIDNYEVICTYHNITITSKLLLKSIDQNSTSTVASYIGLLRVVDNVILGGGSVTDLSGFPTQVGNSGKFLTTNGTVLSWATASGSSISQTQYFEYLNKNIQDYPYVFNYTGDDITSIDYTTGSGVMTKTFIYTLGNVTSIVLSGALPIDLLLTTKILSYDISGNVTNVSYL